MNFDFLFAGRDPVLVPLKKFRMAQSAYAFFRGSAVLFYRDLVKAGETPESPRAWICGDAHSENMGSYKNDLRLTYFDFNDFDEACAGPLAYDILRFGTGILLAHEKGKPLAVFLKAYREALREGKPYHVDYETSSGSIRDMLDSVAKRNYEDFLHQRVDGKKIRIREDRTESLPKKEQKSLEKALHKWARKQENPKSFRVIDTVRRTAGNGSLGRPRYLVLVRGRKLPFFLDLKLAAKAAPAVKRKGAVSWSSEAHRVVDLQTRLQYAPQALLQVFPYQGEHYILREWQSTESKISVSALSKDELLGFYLHAGQLLAWAHLRAAGYKGAAGVDELMAFGRDMKVSDYEQTCRRCAKRMRGYHADFIDSEPGLSAAAQAKCVD